MDRTPCLVGSSARARRGQRRGRRWPRGVVVCGDAVVLLSARKRVALHQLLEASCLAHVRGFQLTDRHTRAPPGCFLMGGVHRWSCHCDWTNGLLLVLVVRVSVCLPGPVAAGGRRRRRRRSAPRPRRRPRAAPQQTAGPPSCSGPSLARRASWRLYNLLSLELGEAAGRTPRRRRH
jgi:hypothetical protein